MQGVNGVSCVQIGVFLTRIADITRIKPVRSEEMAGDEMVALPRWNRRNGNIYEQRVSD